MKTLEQCLRDAAPEPVAMPWGARAVRDGLPGGAVGVLPRASEPFDWRVVAAWLRERGRKERLYADGLTAAADKAVPLARADAFDTAASQIEAEAKRKGLA